MKSIFKFTWVLILFPFVFFNCSSTEEVEMVVTKELKLSVPVMDEALLTTEDVDFEFTIIDGNGGYTATVPETDGDPDAKITIEGNKVIVNLLSHLGVQVTITDARYQEANGFYHIY